MDLIDRYLAAIGVLLPMGQREDIIAELRDALMTRSEDREAELGRPLNPDEAADLLRAFGHPVAVAARYGSGQYLIGPELYPLYALAVKVLLAIVAASAVVTGVVVATVDPGHPGAAIAAARGVLWNGGMGNLGVLTIIAAILQHHNIRLKFLSDWNPKDLPKTPPRRRVRRQSRLDLATGVVVQTVFALWWTRGARSYGYPTSPISR